MSLAGSERQRRDLAAWCALIVALAGLLVVVWVCVTSGDAVVHAHPAYPVLLAFTVAVAGLTLWRSIPRRRRRHGWPVILRFVLVIAGAASVAVIGWLRPYPAIEPALTAMTSNSQVQVTETPTQIVLSPTTPSEADGVFFQPGALVDARAYASVLRPLAVAGHTVVIAKQPLGIAFLAVNAFDTAQKTHPAVTGWVVGGHSLGGTVAAIEADTGQHATRSPVVGLFFYASYPATDMSTTLKVPVESVSGTRDGLATPEKIRASKTNLPAHTHFTVIAGASHAQFGSYGPQPGDNTPTIGNTRAQASIVAATERFLQTLDAGAGGR